MKNAVAFETTLDTTPARISSTSLVADVQILNQSTTQLVYVSTDGGVTRATIVGRGVISLSGVDLRELWVYTNIAGTVISIIGNSTGRLR